MNDVSEGAVCRLEKFCCVSYLMPRGAISWSGYQGHFRIEFNLILAPRGPM